MDAGIRESRLRTPPMSRKSLLNFLNRAVQNRSSVEEPCRFVRMSGQDRRSNSREPPGAAEFHVRVANGRRSTEAGGRRRRRTDNAEGRDPGLDIAPVGNSPLLESTAPGFSRFRRLLHAQFRTTDVQIGTYNDGSDRVRLIKSCSVRRMPERNVIAVRMGRGPFSPTADKNTTGRIRPQILLWNSRGALPIIPAWSFSDVVIGRALFRGAAPKSSSRRGVGGDDRTGASIGAD